MIRNVMYDKSLVLENQDTVFEEISNGDCFVQYGQFCDRQIYVKTFEVSDCNGNIFNTINLQDGKFYFFCSNIRIMPIYLDVVKHHRIIKKRI